MLAHTLAHYGQTILAASQQRTALGFNFLLYFGHPYFTVLLVLPGSRQEETLHRSPVPYERRMARWPSMSPCCPNGPGFGEQENGYSSGLWAWINPLWQYGKWALHVNLFNYFPLFELFDSMYLSVHWTSHSIRVFACSWCYLFKQCGVSLPVCFLKICVHWRFLSKFTFYYSILGQLYCCSMLIGVWWILMNIMFLKWEFVLDSVWLH